MTQNIYKNNDTQKIKEVEDDKKDQEKEIERLKEEGKAKEKDAADIVGELRSKLKIRENEFDELQVKRQNIIFFCEVP